MIACRVCTANGHQAIKLPNGEYVCPLKIRDDRPSRSPGDLSDSEHRLRMVGHELLAHWDRERLHLRDATGLAHIVEKLRKTLT